MSLQFSTCRKPLLEIRVWVALIVCLVCLAGCGPYNYVQWSPDGKHVAVLATDGLRIGDGEGNLTEPILPKASRVSWLPDSEHALVVSTRETKSWKDVSAVLSETERRRISRLADSLWRAGSVSRWKALDLSTIRHVVVCLNNRYGAALVKQKYGTKDKLGSEVSSSLTVSSLYLVDCIGKPASHRLLWQSTRDIVDLRVSSSGKLAAVSVESISGSRILVVPLTKGKPVTIADSAAQSCDWSRHGNSIYFLSLPSTSDSQSSDERRPYLVSLMKCDIEGDVTGALKKSSPQTLAELLAYSADSDAFRLRCLSDGSVIFNAQQRSFPAVPQENVHENLFRLCADAKSLEPVKVNETLTCAQLNAFEPNEDGSRIVVPGSKGAVSVIDVASGNVTTLERDGEQDGVLAPVWRTKDELCYLARNVEPIKSKDGHDWEVVLQSLVDKDRRAVLSKNWSVKYLNFLQERKPIGADTKSTKKVPAERVRK